MDSQELNKIAAAVLCAGIAAFAADRAGAVLARVQPPAAPAFAIAVPTAGPATIPIAARLATASAARGEADASAQCGACHSFAADAPAIVGPGLHGIAGAEVASMPGYAYSDALAHVGGRWTAERLDAWLTRPAAFAPGTKMGFAGIADPAVRADTIAYLLTLSRPVPAPAAAPVPVSAAPVSAAPVSAATPAPPSPDQIKAGQQIADAQCSACHSFDQGGADMIGPNLYGVFGRPIAGDASYAYSAALSAHHGLWTAASLDAWLLKPRAFAPGTKMAYPGLADAADRAAVVAYLRSLSDSH